MPTITATSEDFAMFSKRNGYVWSDGEHYSHFTLNLPKYSVVDRAVLTFRAGSPICGASLFHVEGNYPGAGGWKSVDIHVDNEAASRSVYFYFRGSGTTYTQSTLEITDVELTVDYHIALVPPFQRAENGKLVKYMLQHAEGGKLVPYSLYHAEDGKLVKY